MARRADGKRMTLSEHLALRARAAEESREREAARHQSIQSLRELDARVICNCPACVKRRQETLDLLKRHMVDPRG